MLLIWICVYSGTGSCGAILFFQLPITRRSLQKLVFTNCTLVNFGNIKCKKMKNRWTQNIFCNGTAATTNCITFTIEKRAAKLTLPLALKTNATSGNFTIYLNKAHAWGFKTAGMKKVIFQFFEAMLPLCFSRAFACLSCRVFYGFYQDLN